LRISHIFSPFDPTPHYDRFSSTIVSNHEDKIDVAHLEHIADSVGAEQFGHGYLDHREGDDRGEKAMGRTSDQFDKKYWLSLNFLCTIFAVGTAFAGGIGGQWPCDRDGPAMY
jgi:hypothetical protein